MTFGGAGAYFVPYHLVVRYAWRTKIHDSPLSEPSLYLPQIDEEIGHTVVHYTYTGQYQTLEPKGGSTKYKRHTQYCYSVLVCGIARKYGLRNSKKWQNKRWIDVAAA